MSTSYKVKTEKVNIHENWIQLTEINGELVIFKACDMGNLQLKFTRIGENYKLLLWGQQEDDSVMLIPDQASENTLKLIKVPNTQAEIQKVNFSWVEQQKGMGRWTIRFSNNYQLSELFVTEAYQSGFKQLNQPCVECWDECDEMN